MLLRNLRTALLLVAPPLAAACTGAGYAAAKDNLRDKLGYSGDSPSAGADIYEGASGAAIYLYCNLDAASYSSGNDWGAKIAIHELHHIHQQAALQGILTNVTPPADSLGAGRFVVKNYGGVPEPWPSNVKGVLDALPASMKLLAVPTYVLLIPEGGGGIAAATVDAAVAELEALLWPSSCDGVDFDNQWYLKESNQIAEGEAEYYAANVLMAPGANAFNDALPVPFNGTRDWAARVAENEAMLAGTPGKQLYHLPLAYSAENMDWDTILSCLGWNNNPVGEIAFSYLRSQWRPNTTQLEVREHWIAVAGASTYEAGFETAFGGSWQEFVCDLETHYGIDRNASTCSGVEVKPARPATCVGDNESRLVASIAIVSTLGTLALIASQTQSSNGSAAP